MKRQSRNNLIAWKLPLESINSNKLWSSDGPGWAFKVPVV